MEETRGDRCTSQKPHMETEGRNHNLSRTSYRIIEALGSQRSAPEVVIIVGSNSSHLFIEIVII